MLILRGAPALSQFRLQKLEQRLSSVLGHQVNVYAEFVHFAELEQSLGEQEYGVLEKVLRYGPHLAEHEPQGSLFLVVPRPGTISPWSTKATDIAHNCGLEKVQRLERGIAYYVQGEFSDSDAQLIAAALHDRMTQMVLDRFEAAANLFSHAEPKPLTAVDILGGGRAALEKAIAHVAAREVRQMERFLPTLFLISSVTPLLGLFGTVTGMIKAFMVIEQAGGKVDAQALAGGIWEAMITTGVGLAVAIPLLILLHLLEGGVERRVQSMKSCLSLLLERRPGCNTESERADTPHHWEEITDGI